ncbi:KxYKxGKxW signal peptide domain-containing protein [Limosilactobacillus fermentum]|nr:KxYKxGKxW signal peptide domain-containing protein [Limosilactobacillus fermentum]KAB1957606.1 hypothetical protein F8252_08505 [Limosilactobacillus fermentum]MCH5383237.1 KxYKxGKxW signal peptide domain-containing protein [Limosilactobacillus fermentum]RGU88025.1 hypothetical protein DWW42_04715 [Limosilactobacillus fermentum]
MIEKKKLYKSHKNWVVASVVTMGVTGGALVS